MKVLASAFALILCAALPATAEVRYTGEQTIWEDTVWEGDVLVDGILTVAPEARLEIRPGTVVRFTRMDSNNDGIGEHELFIQGIFLARGEPDRPVVFTSAEPSPRPGDWGAVNMMASPSVNVLEHCRVEYGYRGFHAHFAEARLADSLFRRNWRGAQFQESTVSISRCRFEDNYNGVQFRDATVTMTDTVITGSYWGVRCVYSTLELSGCRIERNLVNGASFRDSEVTIVDNAITANRRGLYLQRTSGVLAGNIVALNSEHGIFLEDSEATIENNRVDGNGRSGFRIINSPVRMAGNSIVANDTYALVNDGEQDLLIEGNWWGTVDEGALSLLVRDGEDRPGHGIVIIENPLAHPPRDQKGTGSNP